MIERQQMTSPRGSLFRLAWAVVCMLSLAGCKDVVFVHQVVSTDDPVEPAPFIGSWTVSEVAGASATEVIGVEIREEGGDLRATIRQAGVVSDKVLALTQLGATLVMSLELGPSSWAQYTATIENGGTRLRLNGPDPELFKAGIESGAIPGQSNRVDDISELVVVEMAGETLASTIVQDPALFGVPAFLLTRD